MSDNKKYQDYENYNGLSKKLIADKKKESAKMSKKDYIYLGIIIIVALLFTFVNLGDFVEVETYYQSTYPGDYIIYEVPENCAPSGLYVYLGISDYDLSAVGVFTNDEFTTNVASWSFKQSLPRNAAETNESINNYMYGYRLLYDFTGESFNYLIVQFSRTGVRLNEVVLTDAHTGEPLNLKVVHQTADALFDANNTIDEQDTFTGMGKAINAMYFDEIYHARTAFEMINGWHIYEWTHPPLGKLIISLGIMLFGMNSFGWRFMGALFSVMTVALMYLFGKKIFKNTMLASTVALFVLFDGLRMTLGRIATVDSFLCFFIMLSLYFMYTFFENGVDMENLLRSFVPFALAGISFGLAVCVKWNGAYVGIALFIMLIIVAVRTIKQFNESKSKIEDNKASDYDRVFVKKFPIACVLVVLFGLVFYIVIPFAMYFFQYGIFLKCGETGTLLEVFIAQQKAIFNYHSGLTDPHNSMSPWWSWLFNGKSVYFDYNDNVYGPSTYARIHCMMTTAFSVYSIIALVYFIVYLVKYVDKIRNKTLTENEIALFNKIKVPLAFILISYFANWIPWAFISRAAYIYHYFPSATSMQLLIVLFLYVKITLENDVVYSGEFAILNGKKGTITRGMRKYFLAVGLIALNFLFFLPVFTGAPISSFAAMFMFGWANAWWGYGLVPSIF